MQARDLMQSAPIKLAHDAPFFEVEHLFVVAQINGAPVVDDDGNVIGMITAIDLLRVVDQTYDEDIDPTPENDSRAEHLSHLTARDVASPEVVWVTPDTPIPEVAAVMQAEGAHRVLVGVDGRLAGILTTFDLLKALQA